MTNEGARVQVVLLRALFLEEEKIRLTSVKPRFQIVVIGTDSKFDRGEVENFVKAHNGSGVVFSDFHGADRVMFSVQEKDLGKECSIQMKGKYVVEIDRALDRWRNGFARFWKNGNELSDHLSETNRYLSGNILISDILGEERDKPKRLRIQKEVFMS